MKRAFNYATILVVLSVFLVPGANAADLSADYLIGRWVLDEQNCSSPDAEYIGEMGTSVLFLYLHYI